MTKIKNKKCSYPLKIYWIKDEEIGRERERKK
jgi:hypothetical protein